jgi:hypothetical protein
VISGGVPLDRVAAFLADCCRHLVVEFVPPRDPLVERMIALRKDAINDYSQDVFERACQTRFDIVRTAPVADSGRILYLMVRR